VSPILLALGAVHLGLGALALRPGLSGSRRLLATTLCCTVPLGGPLLALLVRAVRGTGAYVHEDDVLPAAPLPTADDVQQLAELPPLIDRLMSADLTERQAAMLQLIEAGGSEATLLLEWVVEHGSPDVVLEAALALDELDQRRLVEVVALPH
jgi:hypothetical protein